MPNRTTSPEALQCGAPLQPILAIVHTVPKQTLTTSNSLFRSRTAFAALPSLPRELSSSTAILSLDNNSLHSPGQDVPPLNQSRVSAPSSIPTRHVVSSAYPPSSNHVSVNQAIHSLPRIAPHHGIPTALPKAPNTAPRNMTTQPIPSTVFTDFDSLRSSYLKMLSQPSSDSISAPVEAMEHIATNPVPIHTSEQREAAQYFQDIIGDTSPLFSEAGDDFLTGTPALDFGTSPFESPYDDFLSTPLFADEPLFSEDFDNLHVFGSSEVGTHVELAKAAPAQETVEASNFGSLYTILTTSPSIDNSPTIATSSHHRFHATPSFSSKPTGTRKNMTAEAMVPLDAPTQPRQYRGPSATSRKEVPASFARKRNRSQAFGEEDELELEPLPSNATEAQQIERKRRQNTLAARMSRKRKLEHQRRLEEELGETKLLVEQWRTRAEIYEGVLKSQGLSGAVLPPP